MVKKDVNCSDAVMPCWSMGYSVDGNQAGEENDDSGGQVELAQRCRGIPTKEV